MDEEILDNKSKERIERLTKELNGPNYERNQKAKKAESADKVKVLASFYNPLQGRNSLQFKWVDKKNISKSAGFIKWEARVESDLKTKEIESENKNS